MHVNEFKESLARYIKITVIFWIQNLCVKFNKFCTLYLRKEKCCALKCLHIRSVLLARLRKSYLFFVFQISCMRRNKLDILSFSSASSIHLLLREMSQKLFLITQILCHFCLSIFEINQLITYYF